MIKFSEVLHSSGVDPKEIMSLLQQLTDNVGTFTQKELDDIIADPNSRLVVATIDNKLIGMLTIGCYKSPTGAKAWIEDVVVDESHRGKGTAKKMVEYAIELVRQKNIPLLQLTSNPKRVAANHLYPTLGFKRKETNVYNMKF